MSTKKGGVSLPDRPGAGDGIISRFSSSISESPIVYQGKRAASDVAFVAKKLFKSTGKAAWIAGTTFLILVVPLIIEMDRDAQLTELEMQQASLLGAPPPAGAKNTRLREQILFVFNQFGLPGLLGDGSD